VIRVDLSWNGRDGIRSERSLSIGNVTGGRISRYCIRLPSDGNTADRFLQYPRWAEPVQGLVARALSLVVSELNDDRDKEVSHVSCTTLLDRFGRGLTRRLAHLEAQAGTGAWTVCSQDGERPSVRRRFRPAAKAPPQLVLEALSVAVWNTSNLAPAPPPLSLPTHQAGGALYIRLADIPEHVRPAFLQFMRGRTQPCPPSEDECVYAWDWECFLGP